MEKRKFPRVDLSQNQRFIHFSPNNQFLKAEAVSKNVSATGFCSQSDQPYSENDIILVYLDDECIEDLRLNRAHVIKSGNYLMAKVIWCEPSKSNDEIRKTFMLGCSFLTLDEGSSTNIDLFTRLINCDALDSMTMVKKVAERYPQISKLLQ